MNKLVVAVAVLVGVSACAHAPVRKAAFEPTAFGVTVTGQGRPVILIPCLGCPGTMWKPTVDHLGANVQAHVLTLSGFAGRSAIDKPLIATARAELAAYIRDRHLDHPIVIGHSMGGFLTFWLAATEPDLVGPVVTVDAPASLAGFPGAADYAAKQRDRWRPMSAAEFADEMRRFFAPMINDPARLEPLLRDIVRSDPRSMADAFYELFTTDVSADLPHIKAPLLAILADSEEQKMIAAQLAPIAGHEVVVIPHTKHMVMLDDPDGFHRALDSFIAAHPR